MNVIATPFNGLFMLEQATFKDERGIFYESYQKDRFKKAGIDADFVQDNQSHSLKNVIRGLHFQKPPYAQTKLLTLLYGRILDVVVDLRSNEPTFRKAFYLEMSSDRRVQLLIPKGFAHGYSVLSEAAGLSYKCDEYYRPEFSSGIYFGDPEMSLDWKVSAKEVIISDRDLKWPSLKAIPTVTF